MLLGCRQTGAPGVPLPGQWELAQEAAPVQSGLDRWGQRGYWTGRLLDTGRALRLSGRVGGRNGPPRTPSPQPAGTWGGQADGEEPREPQRAGCERFYVPLSPHPQPHPTSSLLKPVPLSKPTPFLLARHLRWVCRHLYKANTLLVSKPLAQALDFSVTQRFVLPQYLLE